MGGRIEQGLMLVLAVQLDEPRAARSLSAPAVASVAVDEGAAAALRGDLARRAALRRRARRSLRSIAGVFAGPDEVGRGAPAEQQADRFDEDRLPGAGFAGQDVQAGVELDLDRVDDSQVPDAEEAEHRKARTPIVT